MAARILGVSRPTLMKMIGSGVVASHMVGSHHRLLAEDVYAVLRARRDRERAAFSELMELEGDDAVDTASGTASGSRASGI